VKNKAFKALQRRESAALERLALTVVGPAALELRRAKLPATARALNSLAGLVAAQARNAPGWSAHLSALTRSALH